MVYKTNTKLLDAVTSATDSSAINTSNYNFKEFNVQVTGNTGSVTVNIEGSPSGLFSGEEDTFDTKTYTTNDVDTFSYEGSTRYMRATTTSQSASTVTVIIVGSE